MKICPICELNYIKDDEERCESCSSYKKSKSSLDNNKHEVEKTLLPILRSFPPKAIELFTRKEESFNFLKLRLPLLVECRELGKEHCKKEIKCGNSETYRYYIEPYDINGKKYHICSQWWAGNGSKTVLALLESIKDKVI